jgi:hypothetical protein
MSRPAKVLATRLAGTDHAVHTIEGGGQDIYRRTPCATCPWRLDAVGEFPAEAFRHSANTGMRGVDDDAALAEAMHTFACHDSGAAKPAICAGYILRGEEAIGWRIAVSLGKFDPAQVRTDVALFDSYYDMAVANGVPPDDPALKGCKPWR